MVWQNGQNTLVAALFTSFQSIAVPANNVAVFPAGQLISVGSYNSYDLAMSAVDTSQATPGHAICFSVTLTWYDDLVSGVPIFTEIWNPFVVSQNPSHPTQGIIGNGPMHGQYMTVAISNNAAFPLTLPYFNLFGSSRNVPQSDWRQGLGNHVVDANFSPNISNTETSFENVLLDTGGLKAVTSGVGSYWIPMGMFSGYVGFYAQIGGGAAVSVAIVAVGNHAASNVSGSLSDSSGTLLNSSMGASNVFVDQLIFLPRTACAMFVICGTSGTFGATVVAQQGP
jgi:hypothetical protein